MADFVSKAKRSRIMSSIAGRGNETTELTLARALRHAGITGWRRHGSLPGTPDFFWPKLRVALFVDGCFWHGCPRHYKAPTTREVFWTEKLRSNRLRDRRVARRLRAQGWSVIRVWECRVSSPGTLSRVDRFVHPPPNLSV